MCEAGKTEAAPSYGELEDRLESERAARERAERERDEAKGQLLAVREFHFADGKANAIFSGEVARAFALSLVQFYRDEGGKNYVELGIIDAKSAERFTVTVQRVAGKSPHELKAEAESAFAAEREAHEETRRANREAEQAFLDELLARRAAASRLAAAEECLREIANECDCGFPRCQSNIARAFLAGGKP